MPYKQKKKGKHNIIQLIPEIEGQLKLMLTCLDFVSSPAAHGPVSFSQSWILIGYNTVEWQTENRSKKNTVSLHNTAKIENL